MEYTKADETTIQLIQEPIIIQPEPVSYDLDTLQQKELSILKTRNELILKGDEELVEVRELIKKCQEMGLRSKKIVEAEQAQIKLAEDNRIAMEKAEEEVSIREAELEALRADIVSEQALSDTLTEQINEK